MSTFKLMAIREDNILGPQLLQHIKGGTAIAPLSCTNNECTTNTMPCGTNKCGTNTCNNDCGNNNRPPRPNQGEPTCPANK